MKQTTTDGQDVTPSDLCAHCTLTTSGHAPDCPLNPNNKPSTEGNNRNDTTEEGEA